MTSTAIKNVVFCFVCNVLDSYQFSSGLEPPHRGRTLIQHPGTLVPARHNCSTIVTLSQRHHGAIHDTLETKKITVLNKVCYCVGQANNGRIVSRLGVRNAHRLYFVGSNVFFQKSQFWFLIFS